MFHLQQSRCNRYFLCPPVDWIMIARVHRQLVLQECQAALLSYFSPSVSSPWPTDYVFLLMRLLRVQMALQKGRCVLYSIGKTFNLIKWFQYRNNHSTQLTQLCQSSSIHGWFRFRIGFCLLPFFGVRAGDESLSFLEGKFSWLVEFFAVAVAAFRSRLLTHSLSLKSHLDLIDRTRMNAEPIPHRRVDSQQRRERETEYQYSNTYRP